MRVRITRSSTATIDGIELRKFLEGFTYDVGPSLANYLTASGLAVLDDDEFPALIVRLDGKVETMANHLDATLKNTAADKARKPRR